MTDIPVKILKDNAKFFAENINLQCNDTIRSSNFANCFKFADIAAAFKQGSRNQQNNYRPSSILPLSQKYLKSLCADNSRITWTIFFRNFSLVLGKVTVCNIVYLDKWKKAVDSNKVFGAILTDLSKAFDCVCHDLLIAKRSPNGLSLLALKLIKGYLQYRKQRTKIESSYSNWEYITSGVPQGSILGLLFLNITLCDLFFEDENNCFANYADDTTPYLVGTTTAEVLRKSILFYQKNVFLVYKQSSDSK